MLCAPSLNFTGAAGRLFISLTDNEHGWGNVATRIWNSLLLALLLNRAPVIVASAPRAKFLATHFEYTDRLSTAADLPKPRHTRRWVDENGTRILDLLRRPPRRNVNVVTFRHYAWSIKGLDLLQVAIARGKVGPDGCVMPFFMKPREGLLREMASVADRTDAVHARTCRKSSSEWRDPGCDGIVGSGRYTRMRYSAPDVASAVSSSLGRSARAVFVAADDGEVARAVKRKLNVAVNSFDGTGRVIHFRNKPADAGEADMKRIVLDWLAPLAAARVFEVGGSTFWMSTMCWYRPRALMTFIGATVANQRAAASSGVWSKLHAWMWVRKAPPVRSQIASWTTKAWSCTGDGISPKTRMSASQSQGCAKAVVKLVRSRNDGSWYNATECVRAV